MVVGLIVLGLCILGSVALICFKGINVNYHKNFTVKDERYEVPKLTYNQMKDFEKDLNTAKTELTKEDSQPIPGPMDAVIGEIQDLFGPEKDDE